MPERRITSEWMAPSFPDLALAFAEREGLVGPRREKFITMVTDAMRASSAIEMLVTTWYWYAVVFALGLGLAATGVWALHSAHGHTMLQVITIVLGCAISAVTPARLILVVRGVMRGTRIAHCPNRFATEWSDYCTDLRPTLLEKLPDGWLDRNLRLDLETDPVE